MDTAAPAEPSLDSPAPPPLRGWFQFHLSTALLTMLLGGFLVTLNAHPQPVKTEWAKLVKFGWPWTAAYRMDRVAQYAEVTVDIFGKSQPMRPGEWAADYTLLGEDIAVCLAILLLGGMVFEWPVRRDELENQRPRTRAPAAVAPPAEQPLPLWRARFSPLTLLFVGGAAAIALAMQAVPRRERTDAYKLTKFGWPWPSLLRADEIDTGVEFTDADFGALTESDTGLWAVATPAFVGDALLSGAMLAVLASTFEGALRARERSLRVRKSGRRFKRHASRTSRPSSGT
jgi:hypothetical protein